MDSAILKDVSIHFEQRDMRHRINKDLLKRCQELGIMRTFPGGTRHLTLTRANAEKLISDLHHKQVTNAHEWKCFQIDRQSIERKRT